MMKLYFFLLTVLLIGMASCSQPRLTLRAYKEPVVGGNVPVRISENGPPVTKPNQKPSSNYYLYMIFRPGDTLLPGLVWINQQAYQVSAEPVDSTPVTHTNRNVPARPITTVLVDKTSKKVVRLVPLSRADSSALPTNAQKLVESSELVVGYTWKGKTYYKGLKKITALEPLMAE